MEWLSGTTNVLTITTNNRFSIYSNETNSLLIISHFVEADANTYDCIVSNDLVPDMTHSQRIAIINAGVCVCVWICVWICVCVFVCLCVCVSMGVYTCNDIIVM